MGVELETGIAKEEGWVRGAIIGAGASGTVNLAMTSSNGQLFAVKSAAGFSVALDNEYHILQCLDSPYIVRCLGHDYTVENSAEVHNLFMEYMPGGSIADLMSKFGGRLDESVIRAYTRGILRGIHYLHRQGIVHCDIKGKNVLVGTDGVKLADFGSAKRIGDGEKGQQPLQLRGTPRWMAPEVVNQMEQGPASDIWSLACTVLEMATGRPPWSHVSSALAIGCTEELPELPASLSPQIRDFLEKCFRRDPKKRWSSAELLNHPFLNEDFSAIVEEEVITGPGSPTSNLDLGNQVWDSCPSQTSTILSLSIPSPARACDPMAEGDKSIEKCPRHSPRNRVMALAAACEFEDVAVSPNWFTASTSQWIVVRSSRDKSDISNGPSMQEFPFTEEDCSAGLEAVNWEELLPRGEVVECLESAVCIAQTQQESRSSRCAWTLQHDSFWWSVAAHLIDQDWEFYKYSSRSTADSDPGIHNRSILGETFCIHNNKRSLATEAGAACCHCCTNMCNTQCCDTSMIKEQLYIGCIVADSSCNFDSQLIQFEFTWLHIRFLDL